MELARGMLLYVMDKLWQEHLQELDTSEAASRSGRWAGASAHPANRDLMTRLNASRPADDAFDVAA
jgi:hypothetical protein